MPSTPTTSLRLELQQTGESLNTWGDRLNQVVTLIEQAVCGVLVKPLTGNAILSVQNYVSDEARNATLVFTAGTGLSAAPTITLPTAAKSWHVDNRCGYPITFTNGGTTVTVPVGRQADVFSDGANLFMLEPIAAAASVMQALADQAAASATSAASAAGTATTAKNTAVTAKDDAVAARNQTLGYRDTTKLYRDQAEQFAAVLVLSPVNASPASGGNISFVGGLGALTVDAFRPLYTPTTQKSIQFQVATSSAFNTILWDSGQIPGMSGSEFVLTGQVPRSALPAGPGTYWRRARQTDPSDFVSGWSNPTPFVVPNVPNAPVMSAPANGTTNVGAQNQPITFTASAYSHPSGVAQASRRFEFSKDDFATIGATLNGTAGQNSATMSSPKDVLTANTAWKVRCVDVDANGGTATGAATGFTTVAQYKPNVGEAYEGGFLAFERFGDGNLFDLVVAAKSTEASRTWNGGDGSLRGAFSRLNGQNNTFLGSSGSGAQTYAASIIMNGTAGYLGAIDELRAISSKLKPSAATVAAFQSGGSEAFTNTLWWSSTELSSGNALSINLSADYISDSANTDGKPSSRLVRAIKRLPVTPPYPIGTAMEGGYLAAYFTDLSSGSPVTYMLIVADKATEVTRVWDTDGNLSTGSGSRTNGLSTTNGLNSTRFAAAKYCLDLVSGSKDDWYLGAIDEMLAIARMNSQLPSGQQLGPGNSFYWSSTELDASNARGANVSTNSSAEVASTTKSANGFVRPIRRVLLPA